MWKKYGTREETTIGHVVVCTVPSDITCQRATHVVGIRRDSLISYQYPWETFNCERYEWLAYDHCSGYLG
jgi:hypothetical protein